MALGIFYALIAGLMWGLAFIAPLLLPEYPAAWLAVGRYLAFGMVALMLAWFDRAGLRRLSRSDWLQAVKLAVVGNFLYYLCLASAIQRIGAPLPTMIIGTLPVVIAICANRRNARRDGLLRWRSLLPSLLLIAAGIACVNRAELGGAMRQTSIDEIRYATGIALAIVAVACWTWYPLRNADWLRAHPDRRPRVWSTAQGVATLPLALIGYALLWILTHAGADAMPLPLGPRPALFIGVMATIGLLTSWLGSLCWNEASQRMPTSLAGQLIVFETLAALGYAFVLRGRMPAPLTLLGIALLIAGVVWAVRLRPAPVVAQEHSA